MGAPQQTVSVIVHRSRVLGQHHAYVRIGDRDAGYRDLATGRLHCADPGDVALVAAATAPLAGAAPSARDAHRTALLPAA